MADVINSTEFYPAGEREKPIVVNILKESFENDPLVNWLLEKSKRENKLEIMANYIVDESLDKGQVYLSNDNRGAALWHTEKKSKFSLSFIQRNVMFFFKLGLKTVFRDFLFMKNAHRHFPLNSRFFYLYLIGVLPSSQGQGIASKLMSPVFEYCRLNKVPVYLETANTRNVSIYENKGFELIGKSNMGNITAHFMCKRK